MKQKEVEDVFGGKEEFANADSMASKWRVYLILYAVQKADCYSSMSF